MPFLASAILPELTERLQSAAAKFRDRCAKGTAKQKAQATNLLARMRAIFPARKQPVSSASIGAKAMAAPVALVAVPPSPVPAPLAVAAATTLTSLPARTSHEPSALDERMAYFRNESDPVKRSDETAQIIAERDAFAARRASAPVARRAPGSTAPRSVSAAAAWIAQMIGTQDRAERSDLAARVCAALKASIGPDAALASYASERDPARRSEIAQQIIAAREHSAGLSELRSLIVQFEGAHSLESRAGLFRQVTLPARRCGLL